jgi:hypothetical protein
VLRSLAEQAIVRVQKGRGGRSLSFKIELADGTLAYFKPEQTFAAYWYSEVASFHLDRELGLGRVSPVVSRRLTWSTLSQAAGQDHRLRELRIGKDNTIRGAMIAWIEGDLVPLRTPSGWQQWLSVEAPKGEALEPDTAERPAELSDLIVFDYLIGNLDRWGSDNTNVRTLGTGGPLVFLDNANGFEPSRVRTSSLDKRLHAVQRFRRRTIDALRGLDIDALAQRLGREELAPILDEKQLEAVDTRRKHVLEHAQQMEQRYGKRAMPW